MRYRAAFAVAACAASSMLAGLTAESEWYGCAAAAHGVRCSVLRDDLGHRSETGAGADGENHG